MGKSRKTNVMKSIKKTANKTLPIVDKSLKNVGTVAKDVTEASIPVIEKGVSVVYGTMATGLDLGVKGVKSVSNSIRSRSRGRSRSRKISGGRRTRRSRRTRRRHSRRH
jgi:hypothetical protein